MLTCAPEELWICHSRRPTVGCLCSSFAGLLGHSTV